MPARWHGRAKLRRLLKRLPDAVGDQIAGALEESGPIIQGVMRARAPVRRGQLREGILYRVYRQSLRLVVGIIGTKAGRSRLFYGRIQDLGRRAQTVFVQRRRAGGPKFLRRGKKRSEDIVTTYRLNVRAMKAKHFVTGRMPDARRTLRDKLQNVWTRALATLSGGSDD